MERVLKRVEAIKTGNPLDTDTMMGAHINGTNGKLIVFTNW